MAQERGWRNLQRNSTTNSIDLLNIAKEYIPDVATI
jgi:hypothetical protein